MTTLTFEYISFDKNKTQVNVIPNIDVTFSIKLIILNPTIESPSIADSSAPFFIENYNVGEGYPIKKELTPESVKVINQDRKENAIIGNGSITITLDKAMNESDVFKNFWARWSSTIPEMQKDRNNNYQNAQNEYFYALEITQTFKGDVNYAGFSQVDYLPVLGFYNETAKRGTLDGSCTIKGCSNPRFVFDDTSVNGVAVYVLVLDREDIVKKQVETSSIKLEYEQDLLNYQSQLLAQSFDLILTTANYQPDSYTKTITRLLEFQEGTLLSSLDYAKNANLTDLYDLLQGLDTEISDFSGLYPEITIADGEGIPYSDGIPNVYEFFGWFFDGNDGIALTTKDGSSVTNYIIIKQNDVEIFDSREYEGSLSGFMNLYPNEYIQFPPEGTVIGDVFECTAYVTKYVDSDVNFIHSNYGKEVDYINNDISITRGLNGGLYNSTVESGWDDQLSPSGTTWNSQYTDSVYGFSDLDTVNTRTFNTFYNALDGYIGGNALITPLIMFDETTDDYYTVQFTSWTQGINNQSQGGGFAYTRRLINQTGIPTTFKDTLVWK